MLKGLGSLASMMGQMGQIQQRMQDAQQEMAAFRATGSAGGGMVEVEVNGHGELLHVKLDPTLTDPEMIADLIPAAANQAIATAKQEAMKSMTAGISLPGLDQALAQFTGMEPGSQAADDPQGDGPIEGGPKGTAP